MAEIKPMASARTWYSEPIRLTLFQQIPIAILCLLMLDGGRMARICAMAMLGFWCGVAWLWTVRRSHPTKTDMIYVRWGFFPILVVSFLLASAWTRWHQA